MEKAQKKKLKWLFGQPEPIIIEAIHKQRKLYHQLKAQNKEENSDKIALEALTKIAEQIYDSEHIINKKNQDKDLESIKNKVLERIRRHEKRYKEKKKERKKRKNLKKEKIKMLLKEIKIMREQKQSYQAISEYILKYHKVKLHPSYISKILEKEKPHE